MPRLRLIVAATVALILLAPRSQAAELVANGDFSAGNTGFTSSYGYSPGDLWAEGVYDVVGDPQADHAYFSSFGDHTTGSGLMMVVNGAQAANAVIWSEGAFNVAQNADYTFSFWMASAYPTSPAQLITRINGVAQAAQANAIGTTGQWLNFTYAWNSGNVTTATVDLVNANLAYSGNDFALDDMSFSGAGPHTAVPEPATWALMILGFGGIGAMLRRWKPAAAL